MDEQICTIGIGKNGLDNDYTFYIDGRIERFYDRHIYPGGQNLTQWLTSADIPDTVKQQLIERCNPSYVEHVKRILYS